MIIPLNLDLWIPFSFPNIPVSNFDYQQVNKSLKISSHKSASGYVYIFPDPVAINEVQISWQWSVEKFPDIKNILPISNLSDDFALRLGLLLDDGKRSIKLPSQLEGELKKKNLNVSYVNFYLAVPNENVPCFLSPNDSFINYCLKLVNSNLKSENITSEMLAKDLNNIKSFATLKLIGLWIFADSDNSKSTSLGTIRNIQIGKK